MRITVKICLELGQIYQKVGKGEAFVFQNIPETNLNKEIDAWNFLDKFRTIIEELYDKKVFVTCYVVKNENGREILMSRLR